MFGIQQNIKQICTLQPDVNRGTIMFQNWVKVKKFGDFTVRLSPMPNIPSRKWEDFLCFLFEVYPPDGGSSAILLLRRGQNLTMFCNNLEISVFIRISIQY